MKSACIKVRKSFRLEGLIEGDKFLSEAFEDRIDSRRKQSIVPCFKLSDLRSQTDDPKLASGQSFYSRVVHSENCASEASKRNLSELAEIGMCEEPAWPKVRAILHT